ncbi:hypothetical protein J7T55_002696 [Diaporthe amygdali]|uniref:uncharacterized protein n=1 Tax=Phomopsis amygdali TaxID=1214568 RepID=UPI0022FE6DC2|nr:uncharacterized protein J7T55_002696 [Diaporthe amygdali]KAJ0122184.1 hypothetical protein J7T55_002696 [Diaporthe amygdali]
MADSTGHVGGPDRPPLLAAFSLTLVCWVGHASRRPPNLGISSRRTTICHPSSIIPAPDLVLSMSTAIAAAIPCRDQHTGSV